MVVDRFAGGRIEDVCWFVSDGWVACAMGVENLDGVWCASVFLFQTGGWLIRWFSTGSCMAVFGPLVDLVQTGGRRVTLEDINPFNPGMDRDRRGMQYGS